MAMRHYKRVIHSMVKALKPGGRFVGEMGHDQNCCIIRPAMENVSGAALLSVPIKAPLDFPASVNVYAHAERSSLLSYLLNRN